MNANTPVLLGGPHPTAYPEKAVQIPGVDYLVVGEGEIAAGQLIECLLNQRDVSDIKGIVYKKDNRIFSTGRGNIIEDLNNLPMPAYDLIPIEEYGNFARMSRTGLGNYMCIFSSRGCPYRCIYCHNIFGKVFRCRSAENLFNEIKHLYDTYKIRDFEIMDDIFNLDRERLIDFCDRIINSGMKVTFAFPNGLRGDILDRQQLIKLRQAGTIFIAFAIETGSPRMQKLIKKNIQLDKIKQNIEIAHSLRIHPHGFSMIGFPGETLEEMQDDGRLFGFFQAPLFCHVRGHAFRKHGTGRDCQRNGPPPAERSFDELLVQEIPQFDRCAFQESEPHTPASSPEVLSEPIPAVLLRQRFSS